MACMTINKKKICQGMYSLVDVTLKETHLMPSMTSNYWPSCSWLERMSLDFTIEFHQDKAEDKADGAQKRLTIPRFDACQVMSEH